MKERVVFVASAIAFCVSASFAYDWSANPGNGSPQNPYQISEPNHLIAIGSSSALLTKHFLLTTDIVFDPNHNPAHVFNQPLIAYGVLESGSGPRFTGSFNGNNKTIYNLKIVTSGPCRALFGAAKNAVIKNLNMKNTLIVSEGNVAAGLIAFMDYGTILDHCFVSGRISGVQKVGGMVGLGPYSGYFPPPPVQPAAVLSHCFSEGTVTGQMDVGGLVADFTGKISHCGTSATVRGTGVSMWIGGLAAYHGYNESSDQNSMTQCFSAGQVYGNDSSRFVGGLAACITAAAYDSCSRGTIFVGNNSQNIGGFTAVMGTGGIIPVYGSAVNCYSAASISAGEGSTGISGFCTEPGSLENCYFLVSAGPDNGYGEPLDDPNMRIRGNFVGWDFVDDGSDGPNNIWRMCEDGVDYPRLSWEFGQAGDYACPDGVGMDDLEVLVLAWLTADSSSDFNYASDGSGDGAIDQEEMGILSRYWPLCSYYCWLKNPGDGSPENPYQISEPNQLIAIGSNEDLLDKHFVLVNNIDLSEYLFNAAVIAPEIGDPGYPFEGIPFSGTFNGDGYVISNLKIDGADYLGLFGSMDGGTIRNLGLENVEITGAGDYIGAFFGIGWAGTITNCYSTGTVRGDDRVGGLWGSNNDGSAQRCFSNCTVRGDWIVGGLCGLNSSGSITNCYSTGAVSGNEEIGGLCGWDYDGTITNCYSVGTVDGNSYVGGLAGYCTSPAMISSSYFLNTAGPDNGYGEPLTDVQMKQQVSFDGWDFVTTWQIDEGSGYPTLLWETTDVPWIVVPASLNFLALYGGENPAGKSFHITNIGPDPLTWTAETDTPCPWMTFDPNNGAIDPQGFEEIVVYVDNTGLDQGFYECPIVITSPEAGNSPQTITVNFTVYPPGSGTPEDPYLISSAQELLLIGSGPFGLDQCYALVDDIDLSGYVFTTAVIAKHTGSSGGFNGTSFTGTFDGNGHTIRNLTIHGGWYLGLFGHTYTGNSIRNLGLEDVNISATGGYAGGLCGANYGSLTNCYSTGTVNGISDVGGLVGHSYDGSITNCHSSGIVQGKTFIGGLCGNSEHVSITNCYSSSIVEGIPYASYIGGLVGRSTSGSITDCHTTGTVTGDSLVGGLCGQIWGSQITHCYSTAAVNGGEYAGGLCGDNFDGDIADCYTTGQVNGTGGQYFGGLCGRNYYWGSITDCYATGSVEGTGDYAGGLCGYNYHYGSIANCYATGTVDGHWYVGGLCGFSQYGYITNSYSTGTVSGDTDVGGLLGYAPDNILSSLYFLETAGPDNGYGEPLTDAQMKHQASFDGWDFVDIWRINEGITYPYLGWE